MESRNRGQECQQQPALIGYLYDECEPDERDRLEAHLVDCHHCARELESLRSVRGTLAEWTPPEPSLGFRIVSDRDTRRAQWLRVPWQPAWSLVAAAGIVLLVGAALASVEVRYGNDGFAFRMGWTGRTDTADGTASPAVSIASAGPVDVAAPPWRAELVALEDQLRQEMEARPREDRRAPAPASVGPGDSGWPSADEDQLLRRIQGLISRSEQRQQQEMASWLTEFAQEYDMQRRADQQRMQQELGALEGFADYLVRVSQQ